jgi:gliding motility-associated-like protein
MKYMNKDSFEEHIKSTLEDYEVEYDPSSWHSLAQKINHIPSASSGLNFFGLKTITVGLVLASSALGYYAINMSEVSIDAAHPQTEIAPLTFEKEDISGTEFLNPIIHEAIEMPQPMVILTLTPEKTEVKEKHILKPKQPTFSIEDDQSIKEEITTHLQLQDEKQIFTARPDYFQKAQLLKTATFTVSFPDDCTTEAVLRPSLIDDEFSYSWLTNEGVSSTEKEPKIKFYKTGKHLVSLTLTSLKDESKSVSIHKEVMVTPSSKAASDFDYKLISTSFKRGAEFTCKSKDAVDWHWDFGDLKTSQTKNPVHYFSNGIYTISLITTNKDGCKDTTQKIIYIEDQNPLMAIPSFSPDGDGINDFFFPKALENATNSYTLEIYNLKGKLVYKTNEVQPWNGRFMNEGESMPVGRYTWHVKMTDEGGNENSYFGTLNLFIK